MVLLRKKCKNFLLLKNIFGKSAVLYSDLFSLTLGVSGGSKPFPGCTKPPYRGCSLVLLPSAPLFRVSEASAVYFIDSLY